MVVGSGPPACAFSIVAFVEARAFGGLHRSSSAVARRIRGRGGSRSSLEGELTTPHQAYNVPQEVAATPVSLRYVHPEATLLSYGAMGAAMKDQIQPRHLSLAESFNKRLFYISDYQRSYS